MAKKELQILVVEQKILNRIYAIRGEKVMLDKDLAEMYSGNKAVEKTGKKKRRPLS